MPAKDRLHDAVIHALVKDGWTIIGEQVKVIVEDRYLFIDIEASRSSDNRMALIEVKELDKVLSPIDALASAVGKYFLYQIALRDAEITTSLYLAVSEAAYKGILQERIGQLSLREANISLIIFDAEREEIVKWIH